MRTSTLALSFVALGLVVAGCKYDPHPRDGALRCSISGECPEGFSCMANRCWSKNAGQDAGLGGDAISTAVLGRYIGGWTMDATAAVNTECDDGFSETDPLNDLLMTISAGAPGVSDLNASWLCELGMRLDSAGAHLYEPNPSCTNAGEMPKPEPVSTWTAGTFDFSTIDGRTATHVATYVRVDQYAAGDVVNCDQTVTATLTKN
jgi:hypothetical protein